MLLYCDCFSGISGDMFLGALIDLGIPAADIVQELNKIPLSFQFQAKKVQKNGIMATQIQVIDSEGSPHDHHLSLHHHHHRPARELVRCMEQSTLSVSVKTKGIEILWKIAEVEGKIHGKKPEEVQLHEISGIDTLVDITGTLVALEKLGVRTVVSSPIPTGWGFISTAHGELPVPAPATSELLKGIPIYAGRVQGELTTPTGAALISTLASQYQPLPEMTVERIGYGAGSRDYSIPNVLRVFWGKETTSWEEEENLLLETNIDDLSPQVVEYVNGKLFAAGALDVFITPLYMKKQRPAFMLSVLIHPQQAQKVKEILFRETTTLGLREMRVKKCFLPREEQIIETTWGRVSVKVASLGGDRKVIPEYEECKTIAQIHDLPLYEVIYQVRCEALRQLLDQEGKRKEET